MTAAPDTDRRFTGSVAALYESLLVPMIFAPYAQDLATRAAALRPRRVRGRVVLGANRDRADPQLAERAGDADRDLASVGDEHGLEHLHVGHAHILKTPKRGSGSGTAVTTSSAMPRTRRVSAGSITPSSQRRADA